jgi:uncharacterized protein (UPF0248 family)
MIPIKDFLNKIKWDKNLDPKDFSVFYLDNISKKLVELKFNDILKTEGNFIAIMKDNEETFIPLHRVREVREKDKVVWNRNR